MGTYEDLKAAIQQVIRTNGNNEITGDLLQQTLLSIVNSVGANATFAGIATPDTNPGTADQNVFYLATEAGTYVNFGGIEIAEGEAVILSNKTGNWVKTTSGFATQQQFTKLKSEIKSNELNIIEVDKTNEINANYIQLRSGLVSGSDGKYYEDDSYTCSEYLPGKITSAAAYEIGGQILIAYCSVRYYDSNFRFLGTDLQTDGVAYSRITYNSSERERVVLRIDGNVYVSWKYKYSVSTNNEEIQKIKVSESENLIDSSLYVIGGFTEDGAVDSLITSQKVTPFIKCDDFSALHLVGGKTRESKIMVYDFSHTKIAEVSFNSDDIALLPNNAYYFRRLVQTSSTAEEINLDIRGVRYNVDYDAEQIAILKNEVCPKILLDVKPENFEVGGIVAGIDDDSVTTQKRTPYILCKGCKRIFVENYNRALGTYFYDDNLNYIGNVSDVNGLSVEVPDNAFYLRRIVKTYSSDEDLNLRIEGYYDNPADIVTDTGFVNIPIDSSLYENGGIDEYGFNAYVPTQKRTPFLDCSNLLYLKISNYNRPLGVYFYDADKYPISRESLSALIHVPSNAVYFRRVVASYGYEEEVNLSVVGYYNGQRKADDVIKEEIRPFVDTISSVVKPEDFEGATMAEKVKAANDFILSAKGGFVFYFGDSAEYEITDSIVIPSNTIIKINNCTIRMADNIVDNIFRTSNIIPNPDNYHGFGIGNPLETIYNIKIIGEGNATIIHCNESEKSGALSTGWRGITSLLWNVDGFELGGYNIEKNICWSHAFFLSRNGYIHNLHFNTTRENGDGIDIGGGCHDISVRHISGSTEDDVMAIANSNELRLGQRPAEQTMPMHPYNYGIYVNPKKKFEVYNIYIDNIQVSGGGFQIDFLADADDVYNVHASNLSDVLESTENYGLIRSWAAEYGGGYEDGRFHDIFINNLIQKNKNAQQAIWLAGMFHNSQINNVVLASAETILLRNESGIEPEDAGFVITNVKS